MRHCAMLLSLFSFYAGIGASRADSIADFYRDKSISIVLSAGEGGGYSTYVRAFAPFFTNYIPGKPNIIIQNMPGAGGIRAMMYFQSGAPKDGSVLGLVHSGVPFAPLFELNGANFKPLEMNWIGAMTRSDAICVAWSGSGIEKWEDLFDKEFVVGGTGSGSQLETYPAMLNALFGTKIKIISGYKGGNDIYLAMERGEVHGRCGGGFASLESTRPEWITGGKVKVPVVFSLERSKEAPDLPSLQERAGDERTRQILQLALAPQIMDRPFLAPAGVPDERVAALRKAFNAALSDPKFLEHARKSRLEISGVTGVDVEKILKDAYKLNRDVVRATAQAAKIN